MTWPRVFFTLRYISLLQFHDKRITLVMVILGVSLIYLELSKTQVTGCPCEEYIIQSFKVERPPFNQIFWGGKVHLISATPSGGSLYRGHRKRKCFSFTWLSLKSLEVNAFTGLRAYYFFRILAYPEDQLKIQPCEQSYWILILSVGRQPLLNLLNHTL